MGHWGRVANGRGGHGSSYLHRIMFFCSVVFCKSFRKAGALDRATGCSWGVPWGRGVRVEVRRVWGVGAVVLSKRVLMAAGGMGPHAFTASCSFALLSFASASGEEKLRIGLPVAREECHGAEVHVLR